MCTVPWVINYEYEDKDRRRWCRNNLQEINLAYLTAPTIEQAQRTPTLLWLSQLLTIRWPQSNNVLLPFGSSSPVHHGSLAVISHVVKYLLLWGDPRKQPRKLLFCQKLPHIRLTLFVKTSSLEWILASRSIVKTCHLCIHHVYREECHSQS